MEYTVKYDKHSLSLTDIELESYLNDYETVQFNAHVISWGYAGSGNFCVSLCAFRAFIAHLIEFSRGLRDEVIIKGAYEEQFIRFRVDQLGYSEVKGKLARHYPQNAIEFEFLVNQAGLDDFVQSISNTLNPILSAVCKKD